MLGKNLSNDKSLKVNVAISQKKLSWFLKRKMMGNGMNKNPENWQSALYTVHTMEIWMKQMARKINLNSNGLFSLLLWIVRHTYLRKSLWIHGRWNWVGMGAIESFCIYIKVHIFWEGHKILRNLHLTFVLCKVVIMLKAMAFLKLSTKNSNHGRKSVRRSQNVSWDLKK